MKKNSLILITIIGGVILLGIGFYSGLIYTQKQIEKARTESPLANLLASKVINGLTTSASGEVAAISGRSLTINNDGDTLIVPIKEEAVINSLLPLEETETPQPTTWEEIKFEDIKTGDKVNISCQLKADGALEGTAVTVLP